MVMTIEELDDVIRTLLLQADYSVVRRLVGLWNAEEPGHTESLLAVAFITGTILRDAPMSKSDHAELLTKLMEPATRKLEEMR